MNIFETKRETIAFANEREEHNSHLLAGIRQLFDGRWSASFICVK